MKVQSTLVLLVAITIAPFLAALNLARPKMENQIALEKVEEALADEVLEKVQDSPQTRFFFQQIANLLGDKGNLTTIINNAPANTTSLTFVPAVTLLAAATGSTGTTSTGTDFLSTLLSSFTSGTSGLSGLTGLFGKK